jgi:hypothetical protein
MAAGQFGTRTNLGISIPILFNRLRAVAKPAKTPGPTDGDIFRRALGIGILGVGLATLAVSLTGPGQRVKQLVGRFMTPLALAEARPEESAPRHLVPLPISDEQRKKGYHECYPPDPIGLGPYQPFRNLSMGRIAIPQRGGHTADMGYDVIVHFHGYSPVRKTLVQVARGVVYVGIDRGVGSGRYSDAFQKPDVFPTLLRSIESALVRVSGDSRAHIRHLAISAWSAGYGAVNEILKHGDDRIDAVILLDGLHAAWNPAARSHDEGVQSLSSLPLGPTFRFARKAAEGKKIFLFTHSEVVPEGYPSTHQTADLLLSELGLERTAMDPGEDRFGQTAAVDHAGFHLWSFSGANELAHCSHITHIARALYLIEDAWDTPPMDRDVPPTPAPVLGHPSGDGEIEVSAASDAGTVEQPTALAANPIAASLAPSPGEVPLLPRPGDGTDHTPATARPSEPAAQGAP